MIWGENQPRLYRQPPGQYMGGHSVGIVVLEVGYPILPGNVANATTFDFPVRYQVVRNSWPVSRLLSGDRSLYGPTLEAARSLVQDGVRAVVGACGYFANFQRDLAADLSVPVFMSSLLQVPLLAQGLRPGEKVGILCADARTLGSETLGQCGITAEMPIVIAGMEEQPEFAGAILEGKGSLENGRVEQEAVAVARQLVAEHPEVAVILLECSDLPPYAAAIAEAVGRPVWDYISLIEWVHHGVVRRRYAGFL